MTAIDLDKRLTALEEAARGLLGGGGDLLLVEIVSDTRGPVRHRRVY